MPRHAQLFLASTFILAFFVGFNAVRAQSAEERDISTLRDQFLLAYEAAASGESWDAVDDQALLTYALYPYLQARRLTRGLESAAEALGDVDVSIEEFLAFYDSEPVGRRLRADWLQSLARRSLFDEFIREYRPDIADARLQCQYLNARIESGSVDGLTELATERWLSAMQLPIECETVFEWLRDTGRLDDQLTADRVQLLLENDQVEFARIIARRLPQEDAAPWIVWANTIADPSRAIDEFIAGADSGVDRDVLLEAWSRHARDAPALALERFPGLEQRLESDAEFRGLATRALALGLAWDRRAESLELFDRVPVALLDDYTLTWLARAAMWAGRWETVAGAITSMSADQQRESAWAYWAARAEDEIGDRSRARSLYEAVLPDDNFYSAMGAARLGRRLSPNVDRLAADTATLARIEAQPAFVRARELLAVGLTIEARREWRFGFASLPAESTAQTVLLAAGWGWYDVAVATATQHEIFNDYALLYPQPYPDIVADASDLTDLDPATINALIRQESLFDANAISPAGAYGLTQLQPATARRAAARWEREQPRRSDLLNPAVSIMLGAAQLRTLIDEYDGQLAVGLAAYNAGYYAALRWLPDTPMELDVWIENIPFNETRAYVRRTLWHSLVYRWLDTDRAQTTRRWLRRIEKPDDIE